MPKSTHVMKTLDKLDGYSPEFPEYQVAFDLFKGEWSSAVPGFETGSIGLFDDPRVVWFEQQFGGFGNSSVLELGPLEGGHTFMMAQCGASRITAIESNRRAYFKCLIVQQALKFQADFLLGDFQPYLAKTDSRFDFALCSGVLYHLTDPVEFLTNLTRVADAIGIWTHYYDAAIISNQPELKHKFEQQPITVDVPNRQIKLYRQSYLKALQWSGFCGGPEVISHWISKDDILAYLGDLGFSVEVGFDEPNHQNGPSMALYAKRNP